MGKHKTTGDTKSKILDAYIELCAEIGITQVTLQKVAKKAKLSFTTVRYHFAEHGSGLQYEAAMYVAQTGQNYTRSSIEAARDLKKFHPVKSYVDASFDWIESFPERAKFLIYFYYVSGTNQNLPFRNNSLVETARLRTAALIHESIGRQEMAPQKDVDRLAVEIHTVIYGCGVLAMSIGSTTEYKRQRQVAWSIIQKLMRA